MPQPTLKQFYTARIKSVRYKVIKSKELKFKQVKFYKLKNYNTSNSTKYYNQNMTDNKITTHEVYDLFSTADLVDGDNLTQCDAHPATAYPDQVDTQELVTSLVLTDEDMPPPSQMPAAKGKKHLKRPQTTTAIVEQVKRPRTPKPKKTSTSRQTSQGKSVPSTSQGTLEVSGLMLHETQSLVDEVAMMMNEFLELLRTSNSQRFLNTLLANQRNTCLSRFMSKEATEILESFLVRYIHANDEQVFLSNSENNKHLSSPNTMSSTSHTITASTSVPGPSQPAAVEDSTAAKHSLSVNEKHTPSQGWKLKPLNVSSFITWVDPEFQYTVKSPDNSGDYVVKTEVFLKTQIADLPLQKWWKHAIHRSRIEVGGETPMMNNLRTWTHQVENLWLDRNTGVPRIQGLQQEMIRRSQNIPKAHVRPRYCPI